MHKKLNIFEYEISEGKKIELTTIQISNLLNDIFSDYDYLKSNINYDFYDKVDKYVIETGLYFYEEESTEEATIEEKQITQQESTTKVKTKRSYNKNTTIKKLFEKHHDGTKSKADTFRIIAKKLSMSYKAVENAYYKKTTN